MTAPTSDDSAFATRILALLSIVTTLFFVVAAIVVHVVDRQYDPIRDYMSDYVIGPGGWLFTTAIYATALGTISLVVGLWRVMLPPVRPLAGLALIVLFAVGYTILGTFPTDILKSGQMPTTTSGTLHVIGATVGWFSFALGSFLVTQGFRRHPNFRKMSGVALLFSCLAIGAIMVLAVVEMLMLPIAGLAEKSFIAFRELWLLIAGFALLRSA